MRRHLPLLLSLALIFSAGLPLRAAGPVAEQPFAAGLTADERAAIGVDRMDPRQVAALEAAVARYLAGRTAAAVAQVRAEVRPEPGPVTAPRVTSGPAEDEGKATLLDRARVLLRPGTKIEYTRLESRLAEPFTGWRTGTQFRLENGQIWRVLSGEYWTPQEAAGKKITIVPGAMGSFFIEIEGVNKTPRVMLVEGR